MPKYKLIYYPYRGRAEIARYLFAIGGVEYEDHTVYRETTWPEMKKLMPFGQLPVLEVDGILISQTIAIARFVAQRVGLAGKDDIQQALAESYALAANDVFMGIADIMWEFDAEQKARMTKKFKEVTAPEQLSKLEAILATKPSGYFVGDELTWADVFLFDTVDWVRRHSEVDVSLYPKIMALEARIKAIPNVAAWIAKRRDSQY